MHSFRNWEYVSSQHGNHLALEVRTKIFEVFSNCNLSNGFYFLDNGELVKWNIQDDIISKSGVYRSTKLLCIRKLQKVQVYGFGF